MIVSLHKLADFYRTQGQYEKAESLYQRALAICEKAFGPQHSARAFFLENYAFCLRAMDRSQEAESMEARARSIQARTPN